MFVPAIYVNSRAIEAESIAYEPGDIPECVAFDFTQAEPKKEHYAAVTSGVSCKRFLGIDGGGDVCQHRTSKANANDARSSAVVTATVPGRPTAMLAA